MPIAQVKVKLGSIMTSFIIKRCILLTLRVATGVVDFFSFNGLPLHPLLGISPGVEAALSAVDDATREGAMVKADAAEHKQR
jgi:hypothetical protein